MVEFKESEGWDEVDTTEKNRWSPKQIGDSIQGIYLTKKTNVGSYSSIVYVIKNEDGQFDVMGTTGLNNAFKSIPTGYEVAIIYKGEKPSKPPRNPYKIFQVFKRKPGKKSQEEKPEQEQKEEPEKPNKAAEMNLTDDADTWSLIEQIMNGSENITEDKVIHEAKRMHKEGDLSDKELEDIKRVLNQGLPK